MKILLGNVAEYLWSDIPPEANQHTECCYCIPSNDVCIVQVNIFHMHMVHKFSCGTGSPGYFWEKGRKTVVVWCGVVWWYSL